MYIYIYIHINNNDTDNNQLCNAVSRKQSRCEYDVVQTTGYTIGGAIGSSNLSNSKKISSSDIISNSSRGYDTPACRPVNHECAYTRSPLEDSRLYTHSMIMN